MRVLIHPADAGACGHYRLIWPGRALADRDVRVGDPNTLLADWPDDMKVWGKYMRDFDNEEVMLGLAKPPEADVLVVQRPLDSRMPGLAREMTRTDCALVVELDDDFTSIHAQNVSFWSTHPRLNPKRSVRNILETIAWADLVTVTTPALQKVYRRFTHAPVVVIPNYVPRDYLTVETAGLERPEEDEGKLLLGWSGSLETHPQDLQVTRGAVARLLRERPDTVQLTIVGTGKGVRRAFGTSQHNKVLRTGWVPLTQYPSVMKELDVGMVPLEPSAFNDGKSWLKGLEWAALGVPFVASPTQPYINLWGRGAGLLADNPRAWYSGLKALVERDDYRHEVAARAKVVAEQLVIEDHLEEWMNAWHAARESKASSRRSRSRGTGNTVSMSDSRMDVRRSER